MVKPKKQKVTNPQLKSFLQTTKKPGILVPHLERHWLKRPADFRDQTHLHPSAIAKATWCHRGAFYQLTKPPLEAQSIPFARYNMFQEGHRIHGKWQAYIAESGALWGTWEAPGDMAIDAYEYNGLRLDTFDVYREVALEHPELPLWGHADGLLVGLTPEDHILEIKSVGVGTFRFEDYQALAVVDNDFEKAWNALRSPFVSHKKQVQIYMGIAHRMAEVGEWDRPKPPTSAVVIYENKANQDVKEFLVEYSPVAWERIERDVMGIVKAVRSGKAPACTNSPDGCDQCLPYEDREMGDFCG